MYFRGHGLYDKGDRTTVAFGPIQTEMRRSSIACPSGPLVPAAGAAPLPLTWVNGPTAPLRTLPQLPWSNAQPPFHPVATADRHSAAYPRGRGNSPRPAGRRGFRFPLFSFLNLPTGSSHAFTGPARQARIGRRHRQ